MRVSVLGAGGIATAHLGVLTRLDGIELAGVAARSEQRAAVLARRFDIRAYGDWRALLDRERPDAVIVCVPPTAHGPLELELIERRIPFFVEKPLAIDWQPAAEIEERVRAAGLMTAVGYHWRYQASVERAREALADRPALLCQGYWLTRTPAPTWWSRQAESGGQMIEQTTHMFDLARYLLGEPESVYAAAARVDRLGYPDQDIEQVSAALVRFRGGPVATFASTCVLAASHRVGLHLYAEGLAIEIGAASVVIDDGVSRIEARGDGNAMVREDRAFLDAVRTGDPSGIRSPYKDALETHRLTTRALESARAGQALAVAPGG
jgi:predicted dehydrogenase